MELAPLAKQRWFDANGAPLAGGKLYTYEAGTTTLKATYTDRAGTLNTNPVIMDANGYADVWIDSGYYKFVLKDSLDNTLWTKDQLSLPSEAALASAFWRDVVYVTSADSPLTLTQAHNGKLLSVDCTSGAVTVSMPEISLITLPYNIGAKLTNSTNSLTFNRAGTDTFEGATSKVLSTTNASCQFIADIDKSPDQWAFLDFGVVDFSGYTAVVPVAADFATIVDTSDSSRNKKASVAYFRNAVYRSVTTTDAVGADDETMKLSGASFTSTLPAIGNAGKRYKYIHAGTNLSSIYTLATTGGATIGGVASGSWQLQRTGQVLELEDPGTGTDWFVVNSYAPSTWIDAGAMTITATTTNPTKSNSPTVDKVMWRSDGGDAILRYTFVASTTTGSAAGTGDYKFALPANMTADATGITLYTTVIGNAVAAHPSNKIGEGWVGYTSAVAPVVLSLFDATTFRAFSNINLSVNGALCAASSANLTAATVTYEFEVRLAMANWR